MPDRSRALARRQPTRRRAAVAGHDPEIGDIFLRIVDGLGDAEDDPLAIGRRHGRADALKRPESSWDEGGGLPGAGCAPAVAADRHEKKAEGCAEASYRPILDESMRIVLARLAGSVGSGDGYRGASASEASALLLR